MPRVRVNGIELNYDEAGSGPEPLVLVHGWTSSRRNWVDIIPRLPLDRFHVYAFDLRGAGLSEASPGGNDTAQYADDIAAAMTALGVDTFHYVGHSLGGRTGMRLAVRHPQRLRKLVLVAAGSSSNFRTPGVDVPPRPTMRALRRDPVKYSEFVKALEVRPWRKGLVEIMAEDGFQCSEGHFEGWSETVEVPIEVEKIGAPTLMIVGDRDAARPGNLSDASRIPNCALAVFYRVGHMIAWDVPERFTEVLLDFLENGAEPVIDYVAVSQRLEYLLAPA